MKVGEFIQQTNSDATYTLSNDGQYGVIFRNNTQNRRIVVIAPETVSFSIRVIDVGYVKQGTSMINVNSLTSISGDMLEFIKLSEEDYNGSASIVLPAGAKGIIITFSGLSSETTAECSLFI